MERGTNKVLAEEIIKEGKIGDKYTTEAKIIEFYTLDSEPSNKNGVLKEEAIVVTYYFYLTKIYHKKSWINKQQNLQNNIIN